MASLSKREVWSKASSQSKSSMPSKFKSMSRREIWAKVSGRDKKEAPKYTKSKKKKDNKANSKKNVRWVEAHESELFPHITD